MSTTAHDNALTPPKRIEGRILLICGHRVMIDAHLAQLYDVETHALVQAVKRNVQRIPDDFMFQLSAEEFAALRSQTEKSGSSFWKHFSPKFSGMATYFPPLDESEWNTKGNSDDEVPKASQARWVEKYTNQETRKPGKAREQDWPLATRSSHRAEK